MASSVVSIPSFSTTHAPTAKEKGRQRLMRSGCCDNPGGRRSAPESLGITQVLEPSTTSARAFSGIYRVLWGSRQYHHPWSSEGALQQAVAATPSGTHLLGPEPFHHVAGVATVATGQAEVG